RATVATPHSGGDPTLYISGTASILGHETVHDGDIDRRRHRRPALPRQARLRQVPSEGGAIRTTRPRPGRLLGLRPGRGPGPATPGVRQRRRLTDRIADDPREAYAGLEGSPLKAAIEGLRDLRGTIREAVDLGGLTGESVLDFYSRFVPIANRNVTGPQLPARTRAPQPVRAGLRRRAGGGGLAHRASARRRRPRGPLAVSVGTGGRGIHLLRPLRPLTRALQPRLPRRPRVRRRLSRRARTPKGRSAPGPGRGHA